MPRPAPGRANAPRRPLWWYAGPAVGVVVLAILGTWLLWPGSAPPPQPRARQYLDYTACLLTTDRGINDPAAAPVWAGMQDASLATRAKAEYLPISGPQTVDNAVTFVNTLALTHCNLIIAAGDLPATAADKAAASFPTQTLYAANTRTPLTHIARIDATTPATVRTAVNHLISAAVPGSGGQ